MSVAIDAIVVKLQQQGVVIEGISQDYVTLKATIAEMQAAIDAADLPAIQAGLLQIAEILDTNNSRLVALDESVAPPPPPGV